MLKISHLPRIMIRMDRKGKAADFQISSRGAQKMHRYPVETVGAQSAPGIVCCISG